MTRDLPVSPSGPVGAGTPHVAITRRAVATMVEHARNGYPLEIGGHLIGRRIEPETSSDPVVTYIDRGMEADTISTHTHVTFRATNAVRVHTVCEELQMQVAGYYHSHPGFGVFQSGEDVSNFSLYYPYAHQVAVVIDPTKVPDSGVVTSHWLGFFGWDENRRPVLLDDSCITVLAEPMDLPSGDADGRGEEDDEGVIAERAPEIEAAQSREGAPPGGQRHPGVRIRRRVTLPDNARVAQLLKKIKALR